MRASDMTKQEREIVTNAIDILLKDAKNPIVDNIDGYVYYVRKICRLDEGELHIMNSSIILNPDLKEHRAERLRFFLDNPDSRFNYVRYTL